MEAREIFLYFAFLVIAIGASVSLVIVLTYIPLKKLPSVLKTSASAFFQKLYMVLVFSLFTGLIGLGLYSVISYNLLQAYNINEMVRVGIFVLYLASLFFVTLSFKKQSLSSFKIFMHSIFGVGILIIATQENTLDFFKYTYILPVLLLFTIIRYGVDIFYKKW